jgi:hypothetical protein
MGMIFFLIIVFEPAGIVGIVSRFKRTWSRSKYRSELVVETRQRTNRSGDAR